MNTVEELEKQLAEMREENERLKKANDDLLNATPVDERRLIENLSEENGQWSALILHLMSLPEFHNSKREGNNANRVRLFIEDLRGKADGLAKEPRWIVNDNGELGVQIGERCFFCYKGGSIEYEDGAHDDGTPMLYRSIGKREFGETVWPWKWHMNGRSEDSYTVEVVYTPGLSFGPPDNPEYKWTPLPAYRAAQGVEGEGKDL